MAPAEEYRTVVRRGLMPRAMCTVLCSLCCRLCPVHGSGMHAPQHNSEYHPRLRLKDYPATAVSCASAALAAATGVAPWMQRMPGTAESLNGSSDPVRHCDRLRRGAITFSALLLSCTPHVNHAPAHKCV